MSLLLYIVISGVIYLLKMVSVFKRAVMFTNLATNI